MYVCTYVVSLKFILIIYLTYVSTYSVRNKSHLDLGILFTYVRTQVLIYCKILERYWYGANTELRMYVFYLFGVYDILDGTSCHL